MFRRRPSSPSGREGGSAEHHPPDRRSRLSASGSGINRMELQRGPCDVAVLTTRRHEPLRVAHGRRLTRSPPSGQPCLRDRRPYELVGRMPCSGGRADRARSRSAFTFSSQCAASSLEESRDGSRLGRRCQPRPRWHRSLSPNRQRFEPHAQGRCARVIARRDGRRARRPPFSALRRP
jgi:hypothetical protein